MGLIVYQGEERLYRDVESCNCAEIWGVGRVEAGDSNTDGMREMRSLVVEVGTTGGREGRVPHSI